MDVSLYILLSDDEAIIHQTIANYLRDLGHRVDGFYDGPAALESIKKNDYDIAIIDERMPGMNGIDLLTEARKLRPEMSVVIITGHGNMDRAIKALKLGASEYLIKPVGLLELDTVLEKCVRLRSLLIQCKNAEAKLRETRERYRLLTGNAPNSITIVDRDGVIQHVSPISSESVMLDIPGKSAYDLIDPEHHEAVREAIKDVFEADK